VVVALLGGWLVHVPKPRGSAMFEAAMLVLVPVPVLVIAVVKAYARAVHGQSSAASLGMYEKRST